MSRRLTSYLAVACGLSAAFLPSLAKSATVTVNATDSIYNYAGNVVGGGSTLPTVTPLAAGSGRTLTFSSVSGSVILNNGTGSNTNNADGFGAVSFNDQPGITGTAGLSGIVAPNAGYLVGAFLSGTETPGQTAPATLNFDQIGTNFSSLSPLTDQVFFIGDGQIGTATGLLQSFIVPSDATELVLGLVDAFNYNGAPGAYGDNSGSFTASFGVASAGSTATPEPASLGIIGIGLAGIGAVYRRRSAR